MEMSFWIVLLRVIVIPVLVLAIVLTCVPLWIWMERKVSARIQQRVGPNRVGPEGLLQPIADAIKLMFKEDITPSHVDRLVYLMAPVLSLIPAIAVLAVIPLGDELVVRQYFGAFGPVVAIVPFQIADINIGLLYILALSSVAVYGVVLAGWSSNNKWSLMGGVRSAAQMVSYELSMGLSIIAVVLTTSAFAAEHYGSALSLRTVVEAQKGLGFLSWNAIWHLPAMVIFGISALAESNRAPFDLPEAEQELVGGFHTEYSSFRFAMFFMGEYIHMTVLSAIATALFLGGWLSPFYGLVPEWLSVDDVPILYAVVPVLWYLLKIVLCIFGYMWVRWTLPRLRYDQLMKLGWLGLLSIALGWVVIVAVIQGIANVVAGPQGWLEDLGALDVFRILALLAVVAAGTIMYLRRQGDTAASDDTAG